MIPQVKIWIGTVVGQDGKEISRVEVLAPTKKLAKMNFRHLYIQYWGYDVRLSVKR